MQITTNETPGVFNTTLLRFAAKGMWSGLGGKATEFLKIMLENKKGSLCFLRDKLFTRFLNYLSSLNWTPLLRIKILFTDHALLLGVTLLEFMRISNVL